MEQREANKTLEVIATQLQAVKHSIKLEEWPHIVVAYEPVWAIGTGNIIEENSQSYLYQVKLPVLNKLKKSTNSLENTLPRKSLLKFLKELELSMEV